MTDARLLSVNAGRLRPLRGDPDELSGIDKRPVTGPVAVTAPGSKGVSGLAGDRICNARHHGGEIQAVYAYAREDMDAWAAELGRPLPPGCFGENLTTTGVAVTGAVIGEHWRIADVLLRVTAPRIPCGTFAAWLQERQWVRRFIAAGAPGTYLSVLEPGSLQAGDPVEVVHRPAHGVTVGLLFRALTTDPSLLDRAIAAGDDLPGRIRAKIERRLRPVG